MERRFADQFGFVGSDIKDPKSLGWMLRYSPDPGSLRLRELLDELTLSEIERILSADKDADVAQFLAEVLNRLVESPHLYSRSAFETIELTNPALETDDLSLISVDELVRFNRHLLQHLYTDYLGRSTAAERLIEATTAIGAPSVSIGATAGDVTVVTGEGISHIVGPTE